MGLLLNNCAQCNLALNESNRFEQTNLCQKCFETALSPVEKNTKDEPIVVEDDFESILIYKAADFIEYSFIENLFESQGIKLFYKPEVSRVLYGASEPTNICVARRDASLALEILAENKVETHGKAEDSPFAASSRFNIFSKNKTVAKVFLVIILSSFLLALISGIRSCMD